MKKILTNKKTLLIVVALVTLFLATGCTESIIGDNGQILPEKIITLETTFNYMISNEGWFEAFFVWPLSQIINWLTPYVGVSLAIVIATVGINALTFGFSIKSTVSSQKMQMLNPELKRIQEKYKDKKDQQSQMKQAKEMQDLYAKHSINPFGSLVTPFLQLPIILAMYNAAQRAEAVVNGEIFGAPLIMSPLQGFEDGFYILPVILVLMMLAQFLSMKLPTYFSKRKQKRAGRKTESNSTDSTMNTMALVMPVFIGFIALNMSSAMSLYWLISSIVMAIKTIYIQWRYIDNEKV